MFLSAPLGGAILSAGETDLERDAEPNGGQHAKDWRDRQESPVTLGDRRHLPLDPDRHRKQAVETAAHVPDGGSSAEEGGYSAVGSRPTTLKRHRLSDEPGSRATEYKVVPLLGDRHASPNAERRGGQADLGQLILLLQEGEVQLSGQEQASVATHGHPAQLKAERDVGGASRSRGDRSAHSEPVAPALQILEAALVVGQRLVLLIIVSLGTRDPVLKSTESTVQLRQRLLKRAAEVVLGRRRLQRSIASGIPNVLLLNIADDDPPTLVGLLDAIDFNLDRRSVGSEPAVGSAGVERPLPEHGAGHYTLLLALVGIVAGCVDNGLHPVFAYGLTSATELPGGAVVSQKLIGQLRQLSTVEVGGGRHAERVEFGQVALDAFLAEVDRHRLAAQEARGTTLAALAGAERHLLRNRLTGRCARRTHHLRRRTGRLPSRRRSGGGRGSGGGGLGGGLRRGSTNIHRRRRARGGTDADGGVRIRRRCRRLVGSSKETFTPQRLRAGGAHEQGGQKGRQEQGSLHHGHSPSGFSTPVCGRLPLETRDQDNFQ